MPQAEQRLRDKFENDTVAHTYLESHGFKCNKDFIYHPPSDNYKLTADEEDAIDYLCDEWDYGYEHKPARKV